MQRQAAAELNARSGRLYSAQQWLSILEPYYSRLTCPQ